MLTLIIILTLIFANPEMNSCEKYIAENEGLNLKLYLCSEGKTTIGYGRNLINVGISEEEARLMLKNDINKATTVLYDIFTIDEIESWPGNIKIAMIDMIFNLGEHGFKKFKKMITAIKTNNFELAAKELLDSRYARQVPNRAKRNAGMIYKKH